MIPLPGFLLGNWRWIAEAVAGVVLIALLGFARLEIANLKADAAATALAIEKQKTEAANILADSERRRADAEAKNTALNIQLEKDHAAHVQDLDALSDSNRNLSSRLGELLARAAGSRACGGDNLPGTTDTAGRRAGAAAPGGLSEALGRVIDGATGLFREADGAAEVGLICHAFTMTR